MRTKLIFATILATLSSPTPAQIRIMRGPGSSGAEQLLDNAPAGYGVSSWRVGQWVRYSISENLGGPAPLGRFRIIQLVGASGDRYWLESSTEFTGGMVGMAPVRKALVPFGGQHDQVGNEAYVLNPSDSSVQHQTMVRAGTARREAPFPEGWTRVGEEQVTVAAGPFAAVHWKKGTQELWTSADAGLIGVVKYSSTDTQIELTAKGNTGAHSKIPFPAGNNR